MKDKDFLWLHLYELPYFRSLVRANEARFYQDLELPAPILDIGCGDGHFASIAFEQSIDIGIDPWTGPLHKAKAATNIYRNLIQASAAEIPVPDGHFSSAISNSVLEHIPDVDAVLFETARVLKPGAPFIFCVPNHNFLPGLSVSNFFDKLGLTDFGNAYRTFFNRISRHYHCDPPSVWQVRLERAGILIEKWWNYIPPDGLHVVEWGHYFGLPSLLIHAVSRRWILVPKKWNLSMARAITEKHYGENAITENGVYTFYITRKRG